MTKETLEKIKQEKKELIEKDNELFFWINSCGFTSLSVANQVLLKWQREVINEYWKILACRIELNKYDIEDEK